MSTRRILFVVAIVLLAGVLSIGSVNAQNDSSLYGGSNRSGTTTLPGSPDTGGATTTGTGGTIDSTGTMTPGAPETGLGGNAAVNFAILLASGALALGGATVIARKYAKGF